MSSSTSTACSSRTWTGSRRPEGLGRAVAPQQQRPLQQQPRDEPADMRRRREHHRPARRRGSRPSAAARPTPPAATAALSQRLSCGERVIRLGCPKLSEKAPITALIAPLAPIIGIDADGSTAIARRRGIGADHVERASGPRAEHALDRGPAPHQHQQVEAEMEKPPWTRVALSGVRNAGSRRRSRAARSTAPE